MIKTQVLGIIRCIICNTILKINYLSKVDYIKGQKNCSEKKPMKFLIKIITSISEDLFKSRNLVKQIMM